MSLCAHPVVHHDLSQTESQIERIASKTPVFQIVIVTLRPQMTSALYLCRFPQLQAPRSFLLRYLSNAYNRVTASSSGGYLLIIFSRTIFNDVRNVIMTTSEGYFTTSGNTSEDLPNRTMAYGKKRERAHRSERRVLSPSPSGKPELVRITSGRLGEPEWPWPFLRRRCCWRRCRRAPWPES